MIVIVETIASLLGISRDGRDGNKRKKREAVIRREKDTVTISDEARTLVADASSGSLKVERKKGEGS